MNANHHPWKVVEASGKPMSFLPLGNGHMGMCGHFAESSGQEDCVWIAGAGDAAARLGGVRIEVDGERLNLMQETECTREWDMQTGLLLHTHRLQTEKGKLTLKVERFLSLAQKELLAVRWSLFSEFDAHIVLVPWLECGDGAAWEPLAEEEGDDGVSLLFRRRESGCAVGAAMSCWADGLEMQERRLSSGRVESVYSAQMPAGDLVSLEKYALCFTSRDYEEKALTTIALRAASRARELSYDELRDAHAAAWKARWAACDVTIEGEEAAQKQMRLALYALLSAYSAEDEQFGIIPDEGQAAALLPFYLALADEKAARQLLYVLRLRLRPEENGAAAAHAIFHYATYTGDYAYMVREGFEALCCIARYYAGKLMDSGYADWYQGRMAAWCVGLFITQARRASKERLEELGVTQEELAQMLSAVEGWKEPVDGNGCFVQTAQPEQVLEGLYQLGHLYDEEAVRKNVERFAPLAQEGGCAGVVLASRLGDTARAAEGFGQLLLSDPAQAWMALAYGLAGMRTTDGLSLNPRLPEGWQGYSFRFRYRDRLLCVRVQPGEACVEMLEGQALSLTLCGVERKLTYTLSHAL